jgi:hypothetical protein
MLAMWEVTGHLKWPGTEMELRQPITFEEV